MRRIVAALLVSKMSALAPVEVRLRPALREDVDALYALEAASYPADEAASRDALAYRQREAGDFFRVVTIDGDDCAGFVCGTRCATFEEESMATHDPSGSILAIHSVVVKPALRRRGVALRALRRYVHDVRRGRTCATIALMNDQCPSVSLSCRGHRAEYTTMPLAFAERLKAARVKT